MNALQFEAILAELVDENPLAVRAVLKILEVRYTDDVATLAVTCGERPELLVNLAFVTEHCHTEDHVKAVICHEFLHVLLRHTERLGPLSPLENLATDAVINAIIHRTLGPNYSGMMARYYERETGPHALLRPPPTDPTRRCAESFGQLGDVWTGLYEGRLVADDIREVARDLMKRDAPLGPKGGYLGNHEDDNEVEIDGPLAEALDRAMTCMNGDGIWRSPKERGIGADAYQNVVTASSDGLERWRRVTYAVLRRYLSPDPAGPRDWQLDGECRLPVLSPRDKRSFMRALWSPLMPDALWPQARSTPRGTAHVYLDVSGSMNAEMPLLVQLLVRLSGQIRRPFWAFSDCVAPARIRGGQLVADTTGGTRMSCVLEHVIKTRPPCAVVITDGYIERLNTDLVRRCVGTRLHAIVTRDGDPSMLRKSGIAYTQLGRVPQ